MVEVKVRRVGNSLGVVLPKEVIAQLETKEGASLYLSPLSGGGYQIAGHDPDFASKMEKAAGIMARYRNTLRVLAK